MSIGSLPVHLRCFDSLSVFPILLRVIYEPPPPPIFLFPSYLASLSRLHVTLQFQFTPRSIRPLTNESSRKLYVHSNCVCLASIQHCIQSANLNGGRKKEKKTLERSKEKGKSHEGNKKNKPKIGQTKRKENCWTARGYKRKRLALLNERPRSVRN